jgi:hypothetical protein
MTPRERFAASLTNILGWIILVAALSKSAVVILPFMLMSVAGKAAAALALLSVPAWLLTVVGAVGLIRNRLWGYHVIYALTVVSTFGMRVSFLSGLPMVPFLDRVVSGPLTPYFNLVANLAITLVLMWAHYQLSDATAWWKRGWRLWFVAGLAALVIAVTAWVNRFQYVNRSVAFASEVPVLGAVLAGFKTRGTLDVCTMQTALPRSGVLGVFSGTAEQGEIGALADRLKLTVIDREEGWRKTLPLLKSWKLDEARFPRDFGTNALRYSGRVPGHPKLNFQLCWRPADQRFVGQIVGIVSPL